MHEKLFSPLVIEFKRGSVSDAGQFEGYAATFGGPPDSVGDIIEPGAFRIALAEHKAAGTQPALLWNHDTGEPIGKWLDLIEDSKGLLGRGQLTLGTRRGSEALALLKDGACSLSIGFSVAPGGSEVKAGVRHIKRIARLYEVSVVALPANHRARITSVKYDTPRDFETLLKAAGLSNREAKRACAGGFAALVRDEQSTELSQVLDRIQHLENIITSKLL